MDESQTEAGKFKSPLLITDLTGKMANIPEIALQIEILFHRLTVAAGRVCTLTITEPPCFSPYPEDGKIHFIVGAAPPGTYETMMRSHACGFRVSERYSYGTFYGPTLGYGKVLVDTERGETKPFAQLVGNNVYLFMPTPESASHLFDGVEGCEMYRRAFDLVLKEIRENGQPSREPQNAARLESYLDLHVTQLAALPSLMEEQVREIDLKIQKQRQELTSLYNEKRYYLAHVANAKQQAAEACTPEIIEANWKQLANDPLTDSIFIEEPAVYVKTKTLCHELDGAYHKLGSYFVRLSFGGDVSVWAAQPAHPEGIAHPHISKQGMVCFGNLTNAIAESMGALKTGDAYQLVLRWLTEGYDPAVADTKLEEWPLRQEEELHHAA